jgi:hypothetical protein
MPWCQRIRCRGIQETEGNPGLPAPAGPGFPETPACERTTFSSDTFFIAGNVPGLRGSLVALKRLLISLIIFPL